MRATIGMLAKLFVVASFAIGVGCTNSSGSASARGPSADETGGRRMDAGGPMNEPEGSGGAGHRAEAGDDAEGPVSRDAGPVDGRDARTPDGGTDERDPDASNPVRDAPELCDGEDNDSDGRADEEPEASESCVLGTCPGCPLGCRRSSDIAQLGAPAGVVFPDNTVLLDLVHVYCPDTARGCPLSDEDAFSSDCRECLSQLGECAMPCACTTDADLKPSCYACLCERGCVSAFETCAGISHPASCN